MDDVASEIILRRFLIAIIETFISFIFALYDETFMAVEMKKLHECLLIPLQMKTIRCRKRYQTRQPNSNSLSNYANKDENFQFYIKLSLR